MTSKVSVIKCHSYELSEVEHAVREALNLIGGLSKYVKPNQKVLLKPNLLAAAPPEAGINTHPNLVVTLIKLIKEENAYPLVGDSPGGAIRDVNRVWKVSQMEEAVLNAKGEMVNFEKGGVVELSSCSGRKFTIAKAITDVDCIINLPKFKTHLTTIFTGGVKNLLGCVPGFRKTEFHREAITPSALGEALAELFSCIKPNLTIMDGIVGMEGDGPTQGTLRQIGVVLASEDAVSLDAVCAQMMGLDPIEIPIIKSCIKKRLGYGDPSEIEILGVPLRGIKIPHFILPKTRTIDQLVHKLPELLAKKIASFIWIKPQVDYSKCIKCQLCEVKCPVKAIKVQNDQIIIDYKRCIECFCCYELCPQRAVSLNRSLLSRLWVKG